MAEGTIGGTKLSDLPASSYAYCEPGDGAPSTRCHFPIRDAEGKLDEAHVRNALARLSQSPFGEKARPAVEAAAKKLGIGAPAGKAAVELKAEPMDTAKLDRWLAGKISRRILVAPFYGPVPASSFGYSDAKGRDLDGEYFHPETDFYGPYPSLRMSRNRLTDWHHVAFAPDSHRDPAPSRVKADGAIIGHVVLDEDPEDDGLWADFWANAGENRRRLVALLERRQVPMFASTQPVKGGVVRAADGALDVWPIRFNTISTSPQNTLAVMPALKAALTDPTFDEIPADAVKAFLTGLDAPESELLMGSPDAAVTASLLASSEAVKSGRVHSAKTIAALEKVIALLEQEAPALIRALIDESRPPEVTQ